MAFLQSSEVRDLRQKFYELLTDFSTFPASQNFFLVSIDKLPWTVREDLVDQLGFRPGTALSTGLDTISDQIFESFFGGGNNWMFLATGVDLTTETTNVNNRGTLINGVLPVGPFMESREYPDNDLDIQFSDTNISIIDSIFRSWIQLYSVYGNMGDVSLSTDISIYFIAKQKPHTKDTTPSLLARSAENANGWSSPLAGLPYTTGAAPVVTKIYTYKDCIPYVIKSANVGQYDGDVQLGSVAVGFRFSKYDVRIPLEMRAAPAEEDPALSGDEGDLGGWRQSAAERAVHGEEIHEARDPGPLLPGERDDGPGDTWLDDMIPEWKTDIEHTRELQADRQADITDIAGVTPLNQAERNAQRKQLGKPEIPVDGPRKYGKLMPRPYEPPSVSDYPVDEDKFPEVEEFADRPPD